MRIFAPSMMSIEIEKYLQSLKTVCPDFKDEELLSFSEGLTTSKLKKGTYYIKAGEQQNKGAFLVDGFMRGYHTDEGGNIKNIYFIPELEYCFHYASFIAQKPCPLSFQCLEDATIVTFSIAHLQNAYEQFPAFQKYGRLLVEEKLRLQQERLESLLFKNAEQRYLDFIEEHPQIFNRISISQLCSYLGVERQTLTRIRQKLASKVL